MPATSFLSIKFDPPSPPGSDRASSSAGRGRFDAWSEGLHRTSAPGPRRHRVHVHLPVGPLGDTPGVNRVLLLRRGGSSVEAQETAEDGSPVGVTRVAVADLARFV